ncbi:MAG: sporulation protein YabP [Clostridia bacterium]|nr:sporulation protein YabP [Clostridia bacterium]
MEDKILKKPHTLTAEDRKKLTLSGVTDVGAFDEDSITVYTDYGEIVIKGERLQVGVINTETGELSAEGKINSVVYSDRKAGKQGFLSRVLK